jgi:hypothetical protein
MGGTISQIYRSIAGPSAKDRKAMQEAHAAPAPQSIAGQETEKEVIKKKKRGAYKTVETSPLGLGAAADVARKSLLGQ